MNFRISTEEVSSNTHVLNAHLISINELENTAHHVNSISTQDLANQGIQNLREQLHRFDTGYWLSYDQKS